MGGSQSQERVVTVEERAGENGDPQITVILANSMQGDIVAIVVYVPGSDEVYVPCR